MHTSSSPREVDLRSRLELPLSHPRGLGTLVLGAASLGRVDTLLEAHAINPSVATFCDNIGRGIVHHAASAGHVDVLETLVRIHPDGAKCLVAADAAARTPLHKAAWHGRVAVLEFVRTTLDKEAWTALVRAPDHSLRTCLHSAAARGHLDVMEWLLQLNATDTSMDVATWLQDRDFHGHTVLHIAGEHGYVDLTKRLVRRRADLCREVDVYGQTPLHSAAFGGHLGTVEVLYAACPEVLLWVDFDGFTCRDAACQEHHADVVAFLADKMGHLGNDEDKSKTVDPPQATS
eukprot:PhM_4_TR3348/c0_g1_i1/m.31315